MNVVPIKEEELDLEDVGLPDSLEINNAVLKKCDGVALACGLNHNQISSIYDFSQFAAKLAQHYRSEAQRISAIAKEEPPSIDPIHMDNIVPMAWHTALGEDVGLGRTIAVRGPSGNGKTTACRAVLEAAGYTIYHMDCTDTVMVDNLVGGLVPEPDGKGGISMVWRDGVVSRAFRDPMGAVLLDEFDALDPRVAMSLQSALLRRHDGTRYVNAPDAPGGGIISTGMVPFLLTMNTWGTGATREYVGRNAMDMATMDRLDSVLDTTYENETAILEHYGFKGKYVESIIDIAKTVRANAEKQGLKIVFSTRRLLGICELMNKLDLTFGVAFQREFLARITPSEIKALDLSLGDKTKGMKVDVKYNPLEPVAMTGHVMLPDGTVIVDNSIATDLKDMYRQARFGSLTA